MKKIYGFTALAALIMLSSSCNKDDTNGSGSGDVPSESLEAASTGATNISTGVRTFLLSSMSVASDSGYYVWFPNGGKGGIKEMTMPTDWTWTGPDANGWYTRYLSGAYEYYEKIKFGDTIIHITDQSYSGGDGSFENKVTTTYIKGEKNGKTVYNGEDLWEMHNSGYNDISRWEWRIRFSDWDPATSAGTFDWYWGLYENSGGDPVPYHRFEHLEATVTPPDGWLHCHATYYDEGGVETWDIEYDTPWAPVEIPPVPDWGK